ncbi:PTB domain-containing adapter protein ced-6 isoform X2 [Culicoides brevitarsis]|uniref:PTB domain-containing adapter protein ced-6 isoform X2 n=1 Tax=Culicoides brevitarsis TaxID=469753 RepID=UPI00307B5B94
MSTLKFWNKQNNSSSSNKEPKENGGGVVENGKQGSNGRNWLHQPDALTNGHVAYLVKYLGNTPVDQPKGIEVVKEAIRKLQFTQQIKKAENGSNYKTKKVEITVSIDGVAIQEPRSNNILHQFPLHKISYCADEKGAKKFFSFIAKTGTGPSSAFPNGEILSSSSSNSNGIQNGTSNGSTNGTAEEGHECFVFISNKLASDITLTIGQAFDLAYKRYVNDNGKTAEVTKLQQQNRQLENTVTAYRQRLKELTEVMPKNDLERLLVRLGLRDILEVPQENGSDGGANGVNGSKTPDLGIDVSTPSNDDQLLIETSPKHFAPIVPPRNMQNPLQSTLDALKPSVGTKLEGLLLNSDSDSDFDPRAEETDAVQNGNKITNDLFGYEPPKQSPGQQLFTNNLLSNGFSNGVTTNGLSSPPPLLAPPPKASTPRRNTPGNNVSASQDLFGSTPFSMQPTPVFDTSFKKGLSFDDFTLESLDPLSSK